jgi:hypothetical protein
MSHFFALGCDLYHSVIQGASPSLGRHPRQEGRGVRRNNFIGIGRISVKRIQLDSRALGKQGIAVRSVSHPGDALCSPAASCAATMANIAAHQKFDLFSPE